MKKYKMSYEQAHNSTKEYYNAKEFNLYHSDVIVEMPEQFNGAYDVIGSSYRAFEKVIDILVIIYRNFEIKPFLTIIDVIKNYLQT